MTTRLTAPMRREIEIEGEPFTLTLTPTGLRLARKRFRSGRAISWEAFWRGEAGELEQSPDSGR